MDGEVVKIERIQTLSPSQLPEGVYLGTWSGYTIEVAIGGVLHRLDTSTGVRGLNVPCEVTVSGGHIGVTTVRPVRCSFCARAVAGDDAYPTLHIRRGSVTLCEPCYKAAGNDVR